MGNVQTDSTRAYDDAGRVQVYDSDMEIMHPLRSKMIEVALEVLPFDRQAAICGVDLGVGTGFFTSRFLQAFPRATVVAVDGAEAMLSFCRARLGDETKRVEFVISDFQQLSAADIRGGSVDVVFSAYALHHLTAIEKKRLVETALEWMKPGGWFVNADLVVARDPAVEQRIQQLRVDGVVARANAADPRFATAAATRAFLNQLENDEKDQPLSLLEDLSIAAEAGLAGVEVFWKEHREAVWGGPKAA